MHYTHQCIPETHLASSVLLQYRVDVNSSFQYAATTGITFFTCIKEKIDEEGISNPRQLTKKATFVKLPPDTVTDVHSWKFPSKTPLNMVGWLQHL